MDGDLLPCAHCGGKAKSYHHDSGDGWSNTDWVCCVGDGDGDDDSCGMQTCLFETREQAVACWNRRPTVAPQQCGGKAPPYETKTDWIRRIREERGIGISEAKRIVEREIMLDDIAAAETIQDIKALLVRLI